MLISLPSVYPSLQSKALAEHYWQGMGYANLTQAFVTCCLVCACVVSITRHITAHSTVLTPLSLDIFMLNGLDVQVELSVLSTTNSLDFVVGSLLLHSLVNGIHSVVSCIFRSCKGILRTSVLYQRPVEMWFS